MGLLGKIFGFGKNNNPKTENVEHININDIWFSLPTISNEFPQTIESNNETENDIHIHEDDYRQNEFLKPSYIPLIEQEIVSIKDIWENFSKKSDDYILFKKCHVRSLIGNPHLNINFTELKSLFNISQVGIVKVNNSSLINSFSFKTKNTTYYGTTSKDNVTELCIFQWNDDTLEEIQNIIKTYELVFVNWYHYDIIE